MNVASLCEREIVTVPASASVRDAAATMRDQHVGALAVTDPYAPDRVIGIVTDRDLVLDLLATGHPTEGISIGAVCRTELAGVPGSASCTMKCDGSAKIAPSVRRVDSCSIARCNLLHRFAGVKWTR